MNPQGVTSVSAADVPQILSEAAGAAAPVSVTDEDGVTVSASALTALFDSSGTYIGSYGIDPSTGAFAAWDANGNETSFQTFAAEHQLANGATPVASDGGNAVLYNSSGQIIGLSVAGYVVGSQTGGTTAVYNETGQELATFGLSQNGQDIDLSGSSADILLESLGFSVAQISQVAASLGAAGAWDLSDPTQAAMHEALIEGALAGNTAGNMGTNATAVYNAQGGYVGQFAAGSAPFSIVDQDGDIDSTPVLQDDDITAAEESLATELLSTITFGSGPISTSGYTNLRQINQALSAYLLSTGSSDPLSNALDVYDSNGNYYGNVGIDTATGQLAMQEQGGGVIDVSSAMLAQYGLSAATVGFAQQNWVSSVGDLTQGQATELSTAAADLGGLLQQYSGNPFENLTSAQIAAMSAQELSSFTPWQLSNLNAADIAALSQAQLSALSNLSGLSAAAVAGLSAADIESLAPSKLSQLNLSGFSTQQMSVLAVTQVGALTSSQVGSLSAAQVNALSPAAFAALNLSVASSAAIGGLSATIVQGLSSAQIASLSQAAGVAKILDELSPSQVAAIQPAVIGAIWNDLSTLSNAQIAALTPTQLGAISAYGINGLFSIPQWESLSMPQLQALNLSDLSWQLGSLSESVVQSFTPAQISNLGTLALQNLFLQNSDCGSQYLTTSQLQALGGAQIQELGGLVYYLTDNQVASLTPAQFAALSPQQISEMQVAQIAAVTPQQWAAATDAQIGALSAAQIGAIAVGALGGLSGAQMDAISTSSVAGFTSAQLYALTGAQVSSLSDTALGGLSAEQVGSLNVSDVTSMSEAQFDEIAADATGSPSPTPTSGGGTTFSGVHVVQNPDGTYSVTGTINVTQPGTYYINGEGTDSNDPSIDWTMTTSQSAYSFTSAGSQTFSITIDGGPLGSADPDWGDTTDFTISASASIPGQTTNNAGTTVDFNVAGLPGWPIMLQYLPPNNNSGDTDDTTFTDDNGDSISGYWNADGQFEETMAAAPSNGGSMSYSFYDNGILSQMDVVNPDGTYTNSFYDTSGNLTATDTLNADGSETITDYDAEGNIVAQTTEQNTGPTNTTGAPTSASNPGGLPL